MATPINGARAKFTNNGNDEILLGTSPSVATKALFLREAGGCPMRRRAPPPEEDDEKDEGIMILPKSQEGGLPNTFVLSDKKDPKKISPLQKEIVALSEHKTIRPKNAKLNQQ